jgi:cellulose synthase/poly-beta-1,6-N-acetylglucosamine synthase-like glycosyltransferase
VRRARPLHARRQRTAAPKIVAVIPAHDEESLIADTIESLRRQGHRIAVTVVADNCSDGTAEVGRRLGCRVIESVDNADHKAGALNQALARMLPACSPDGYLLVLDADTVLGPTFVSAALGALEDSSVGAVGGIFRGIDPKASVLASMQSNEYDRYARQVGRRQAKAFVLTGTATLFRVKVLRELVATRGYVYETRSRTEDNEVTLAIRHLGYRAVSPKACTVHTELMPDLRHLWRQRYRWYRGAAEDLRRYGWTQVTATYIVRQGMLALSAVMTVLYLVVLGAYHSLRFAWPWTAVWGGVTVVFVVERAWTVRRGGARSMGLAALLIPELVYSVFLQANYVAAVSSTFLFPNARRRW